MTRLDQFLDFDDAARDRTARISSLAGFSAFLLGRFLFELHGRNLGYAVALVVVSSYLVRLWWYCKFAIPELVAVESPFLGPRRFAMAAASAAILGFFGLFPPARVEAATLERRVRGLATGRQLSPSEADGIADALTTASNHSVALSAKTLAIVRDAIKNSDPDSAVARAANALVNYNNDIHPPERINPPQSEAQRAFLDGSRHSVQARAWNAEPKEAEAAISALSRSIELSGADYSLKVDALLDRAQMYTIVNKPDQALADVKSAEDNGALDLSSIISTETAALMRRGRPDDLKTVISLVTLGLQIEPPKWLLAVDPRMETLYRVELIQKRTTAEFLLGEFAKSAEDARLALNLAPPHAEPVSSLFAFLISSYLNLGQSTAALAAAEEWKERTGDPRVEAVQRTLRTYQAYPRRALEELNSSRWFHTTVE